jgi:hypothetical protein
MHDEQQRGGHGGADPAAQEIGAVQPRRIGAELRQRQSDGGRGAEERDREQEIEHEQAAELTRAPEDLE